MKTVFVTGSDGFIGSALCSHLELEGYQVLRGVRQPGERVVSRENGVVVGDIGPTTDWNTALKDVEVIIHLAARVHVLHETEADPLSAFRRVNTRGTERLALSAGEQKIRRFIFISTIGVHGSASSIERPFSELSPVAPHGPYAQSKWEAERILRQTERDSGLEVVIVRPPLVYGPGVPGNFSRLMRLVDSGLPLPLRNVSNRRSFVSRSNLITLLIQCVDHPSAAGETFLISDGENVSTTDLIRKIARHLGRPARLFPFPVSLMRFAGYVCGRKHTIGQLFDSLVVDSSKARNLLDWQPVVSMDEELAATAEWFRRENK